MELSEDLIKRRSKHFDLACITLLDLSGAEIDRLAHLDKCANVVEINLQHNLLRNVEGLPSLAMLQTLDLTGNQLTTIDNLPPCPALEELSFAANEVESVDFQALAAKFPQLRRLHFQDNPVSSHKDALVALARAALPNLLLLNGEAVAFANIGHSVSTGGPQSADPTKVARASSPGARDPRIPDLDATLSTSVDVSSFIEQSSRRIDELLLHCHKTLEAETARVLKAFNTPSLE